MMDIYDQILENLELERELGTRTVEIDRALLVPPEREVPPSPDIPAAQSDVATGNTATGTPQVSAQEEPVQRRGFAAPTSVTPPKAQSVPAAPSAARADSAAPGGAAECDIAFFTGRPLSDAGEEAMRRTFAAIGKIRPGVRLLMNERCKARVIVMLGSDAMRKRFPAARPVRGAWLTVGGIPAITTFSPDFIFTHFQPDSPHMNEAKREMWNDIKSAVARLG